MHEQGDKSGVSCTTSQEAGQTDRAYGGDVAGGYVTGGGALPLALPPVVEPAAGLTDEERRRYARQITVPQFGKAGQRRVKNARVLCVGAGGLGSPVLLYLAAAGVGTLGIVDFDTVEESNLHRQVIHRQADLGRPKVQSARDAIAATNPLVAVRVHAERLTARNARRIIDDYDVVVDGSDNFATRYLVNDACVLSGKPYVWASILRFDGQIAVFWPPYGPCYRCVFPTPPPVGAVPSCAQGGVLGALCGTIGSIQATEALKVVAGVGEPLVGRILVHDALDMDQRTVRIQPNPQCAICSDEATITELVDYDEFCGSPTEATVDGQIGVDELARWLDDRRRGIRDFVLVDVREDDERARATIAGSVGVPVGGFLDGSALAAVPADRQIVLFCEVGARSAQALAVVRAAGRADAVHVAGGMAAWSAQCEQPAQPARREPSARPPVAPASD